ncbi:MAG: hypothetical protein K2Q30_08105 [Gemmataceae bacterium]|jgi:hypothetical protein|nr:hypothetical protein [Gemmataceae bacterium]
MPKKRPDPFDFLDGSSILNRFGSPWHIGATFFSVVNQINFASMATVNRPPDLSRPAVTRIKPPWQFNPGELF